MNREGETVWGEPGRDHASGDGGPSKADTRAVTIRPAQPADCGRLWELVRQFAKFEKLEALFTGSAERLAANLFGEGWPRVEALVAEVDGEMVGFAIFYGGYSTFWTRPLLWLEDLFVVEAARGQGVGRALFAAVARIAAERGCSTMDWAVLDWNTSAIEFYERLGARRNGGWFAYRLAGRELERCGSREERA